MKTTHIQRKNKDECPHLSYAQRYAIVSVFSLYVKEQDGKLIWSLLPFICCRVATHLLSFSSW